MDLPPDLAFTKALPKTELHAHLTGSISKATLHKIWQSKDSLDSTLALEDPLTALPPATANAINLTTFFPLFDTYIYTLISDLPSIILATTSVLEDFLADGIVYLELRTTPRAIPAAGVSKEDYVTTVLGAITSFNAAHADKMTTKLILSIDRKNSLAEAQDVLALALRNRDRGIVGLDLCGNPTRVPISHFGPVFAEARERGLGTTVHFAEVAGVAREELDLMLDWQPQRLGHVIHVPAELRRRIREKRIGLELCLSCNVLAGMLPVSGAGGPGAGFAEHHFGEWWKGGGCAIALGTDDVGVFGSALSQEYLLAAEHFGLGRRELVRLGRSAVECIFGGEEEKKRLSGLWDRFEREIGG